MLNFVDITHCVIKIDILLELLLEQTILGLRTVMAVINIAFIGCIAIFHKTLLGGVEVVMVDLKVVEVVCGVGKGDGGIGVS